MTLGGARWRTRVGERNEEQRYAADTDRLDPGDRHEGDDEDDGFDDKSQRFLERVAIGDQVVGYGYSL